MPGLPRRRSFARHKYSVWLAQLVCRLPPHRQSKATPSCKGGKAIGGFADSPGSVQKDKTTAPADSRTMRSVPGTWSYIMQAVPDFVDPATRTAARSNPLLRWRR
jgi:hypothetical protein